MASEDKQIQHHDWSPGQQTVLPSFSVLFKNEASTLFLPLPSPYGVGQRPYPSRANSFPTLRADRTLPRPYEWPCSYAGSNLRPLARGQSELVHDVPTRHQIPSRSLTASRSSSVCSASSFERHVDPTKLDVADVVRSARCMLVDSPIESPYEQGWFQPDSQYSKRLEEKLERKGLGDLVEAFFHRDENRALYGDRVTIPRRHASESRTRKEGQKKHGEQEEARRNRHRECQHDSHERCPEIAAECGADHAKETKITRTQAGKGPGKDEQLYAAIYTQEMAGRLVQALNDRLKRAEHVVQLLLQTVDRQRQDFSSCTMDLHHDHRGGSRRISIDRPSYVGMKRKREEVLTDR